MTSQENVTAAGRPSESEHDAALTLGKQSQGRSSAPIYDMAASVVMGWKLPRSARIADIGGGAGQFARKLLDSFDAVDLVDHEATPVPARIIYRIADLNDPWPIESGNYDGAVSLEVIEHLENPRHFMRELARILRGDGRCFVTTPNQLSISSKACLAVRGQFRDFSSNCYPAHITALVKQDLERIANEAGFKVERIHYTNSGRIPFSHRRWQAVLPPLGGQAFSDNIGLSLVRNG